MSFGMESGCQNHFSTDSFLEEKETGAPYIWRYPLVNVYITDGKITMLLMGKLTISMAIFNSYVKLPEGTFGDKHHGFLQPFS